MAPAPLAGGAPEGYAAVSPWIISRDTRALIAFAEQAFGAEELGRMEAEGGRIEHAELRIGDAVVLAFDAPEGHPGAPAYLRLWVTDADAAFAAAQAAGADAVTQPTELFWGDKVGRVRDPLGNLWWLQQRLADLSPEEIGRRAQEPRFFQAAMAYVQGAGQLL
jgi:uncharacterized glyoxalase superfamily protein PhnB